ncbi:proline-rich protein [Suillus clintonianus]|uniref:proline-rich protein n=1 Tax=Suillus clintonianus TaxID=1904413 RepID=UPI001B87043C|nr:proline-rich protein [Suillus clintonianus]KAG2143010.1 proline-rich protein [Suillus clintonianus]
MASAEPTHETVIDAEPTNEEHQKDQDASDAQAQIIASLRSQVTDLFSQVTQLNGKLVKSYDRVSDLEDQLHDSESSLRNASVAVSSLELERTHHLAALNTGLLVEKEHVTAELNRLMERATEEAAQRGQAETARSDIEKELDDLSASLFHQANTMVAEARLGRAQSERKVREAEEALNGAEEAVKVMQTQMQRLQADKESAERQAEEARLSMGKGKWVDRDAQLVHQHPVDVRKMRLVTIHVPYAEFIAFVTHLRGLRASQVTSPVISTLQGLPFLARLITEDSEPTVRLDLAPSLNWLSRRSVLSAIHTGTLIIEPVPFSSLVQELHPHSQTNTSVSISCALCGTAIVRAQSHETPPSHPLATLARSRNNIRLTNGNLWFKNPLSSSSSSHVGLDADIEQPEQVYVFRVAPAVPAPAVAPVSLPLHTSSPSTSTPPISRPPAHPTGASRTGSTQTQQPYPLCTSNYCLLRLRSTCSLWAFVRTCVVERIWEEEPIIPDKKPTISDVNGAEDTQESNKNHSPAANAPAIPAGEKPPVPPRRRRLWEMASALGERWTENAKDKDKGEERVKEKDKDREKETEKDKGKGKDKDKELARKLPPPPPARPSVAHPHAQVPPPLPKRSEGRGHSIDTPAAISNDADKNAGSEAETSNSQESFTTPVDEMSFARPFSVDLSSPQTLPQAQTLQLDRPPSPHTIPLPETPTSPAFRATSPPPRPRSRVASPAPLPSRVSSPIPHRPGTPIAPSRSRTGSPAPPRTSSPFSPSRAASPAPNGAPPVPRRAPARRAVPVPPTAAQTETKEGIPMPSAEVGKDENLAKAEAPASVKEEEVKPSPVPEQKAVAGEDAVELSMIKHEIAEPPIPLPDTSLNGDLSPPKRVSMDVPLHTAAELQPVVDRSSEAGQIRRLSEDSTTREKSIDTSSTKRSSTTDEEGYAGDATWEDRTWKEIVRLKEDMFWARVGGVR